MADQVPSASAEGRRRPDRQQRVRRGGRPVEVLDRIEYRIVCRRQRPREDGLVEVRHRTVRVDENGSLDLLDASAGASSRRTDAVGLAEHEAPQQVVLVRRIGQPARLESLVHASIIMVS
jgi:hypothetical protein